MVIIQGYLFRFVMKSGEVFAYQGRAFGNEQPKYITIKIDEEREKIFGLDKVDKANLSLLLKDR